MEQHVRIDHKYFFHRPPYFIIPMKLKRSVEPLPRLFDEAVEFVHTERSLRKPRALFTRSSSISIPEANDHIT
jgi:hypothetical protein